MFRRSRSRSRGRSVERQPFASFIRKDESFVKPARKEWELPSGWILYIRDFIKSELIAYDPNTKIEKQLASLEKKTIGSGDEKREVNYLQILRIEKNGTIHYQECHEDDSCSGIKPWKIERTTIDPGKNELLADNKKSLEKQIQEKKTELAELESQLQMLNDTDRNSMQFR